MTVLQNSVAAGRGKARGERGSVIVRGRGREGEREGGGGGKGGRGGEGEREGGGEGGRERGRERGREGAREGERTEEKSLYNRVSNANFHPAHNQLSCLGSSVVERSV